MGGEEAQEGGKGGGRRKVPEGVEEDDVCIRSLGRRDRGEVVFWGVFDPADARTQMGGGEMGLGLADCDGGAWV